MPTALLYRSQTATLSPPATSQIVSITSESGRLKIASVICVYATQVYFFKTAAQLYGQIFLSSTQTPEGLPLFLLASGYFGGSYALGWDGDLPLNISASLFCRFYATADTQVQLTIGVEK